MIVDLDDSRAEGVLPRATRSAFSIPAVVAHRTGRARARRPPRHRHRSSPPGRRPGRERTCVIPPRAPRASWSTTCSLRPETEWSRQALIGIYAAILTDTGSFRFSNATPRSHAIATDLIDRGVDPEEMYRRIFATVPLRRIALLRHALERLDVDPVLPITWITIESGIMESLGCTSDDWTASSSTRVPSRAPKSRFCSVQLPTARRRCHSAPVGPVDVNAVARRFGGGGHAKASGALMGRPLQERGTSS